MQQDSDALNGLTAQDFVASALFDRTSMPAKACASPPA
jgi:hypothetical protein